MAPNLWPILFNYKSTHLIYVPFQSYEKSEKLHHLKMFLFHVTYSIIKVESCYSLEDNNSYEKHFRQILIHIIVN